MKVYYKNREAIEEVKLLGKSREYRDVIGWEDSYLIELNDGRKITVFRHEIFIPEFVIDAPYA